MSFWRRKDENAWLAADERERRKTILIVIGIVAIVLGTIGVLAWAVMHHG